MADIWMDVDVALSKVPVNIMPLIDATDFKTRKEAVAYNAAGLELIWHFTTTAGATSATVVTPTTSGAYDWAHQDGGMYTIEIPASGGASINNNAEGFGWFTGVATGVLPWRGPIIGFRAAGLNNLLVDSAYSATRGLAGTAVDVIKAKTDKLPANTSTVLGTPAGASISADIAAIKAETATIVADTNELQTDWHDGGRLDLLLDDAGGAGTPPTVEEIRAELEEAGSHLALIKAKTDSLTFTVAGDVDVNVQTWKGSAAADMTGDAYARLGAPSGASVSADIAAIPAPPDVSGIEAVTEKLDTMLEADDDDYRFTEAALVNAPAGEGGGGGPSAVQIRQEIDANSTQLIAIKAKTDNLPANTSTVLGTPAGASISADIAAIKAETATIVADTNELQTDWHDGGRLDLLLDDAGGAGTPPTVEEIRAELEEAGSHLALIKAKTDSLTFTVAGDVDVNVQTWKGSAAADMTGDAYARLGAPVGASVSADIANVPTAVENADALLKRDWTYVTGEAARSVLNALRLLRNKVDTTTTPGTLTVCEEDDSTPAWTAAITTDAAAEPITEIDPA